MTAKGKKSGEQSRLDRLKRDGIEPDVPPNPLPYLTGWLFEIGPTVSNGMGGGVVGWTDLAAWQALTGVELDPWEARTIRNLSAAYLGMTYDAKDPSCPQPFASVETIVRNRESVSKQISNSFKALAMAKSHNRVGVKKT